MFSVEFDKIYRVFLISSVSELFGNSLRINFFRVRDEGSLDECVKLAARAIVESRAKPRGAEEETTACVASFTRLGKARPYVLYTILFVNVHGMYNLRRLRNGAECKFFWKCACATDSFIFPFKVRMCNRNLYFPVRCAHAQQYFPCPVIDLVTLRPPHMRRKSYIPCACHQQHSTERN